MFFMLRGLHLVRVCASYAVVEVLIRVTSLPRTCAVLGIVLQGDDDVPQTARTVPQPAVLRRVLRDVARVGRWWPFEATCLRTSLVQGELLRACDPVLVIGVRREVDNGLLMHSWIEINSHSLDPTSRSFDVLRAS